MKKLVIIIVFLSFGINIFAQSAKENYFSAVKAYKSGNYTEAVQYLDKVVQQLGSTNIRVQPLLVKSLAGSKDWRRAKTEIANYYNLNPDTQLAEYQEMVKLEKEVENKIQEEEQLFANAKYNKSVSEYQSYLEQFPYGKYRSEVQVLLSKQKDENAWQKAKKNGSIAAYYNYLKKYPDGKYANTATANIKVLDKEAYENAVSEGTQQSLNYYLFHYPRGEYRDIVKRKLDEKIEYDVYMHARNHNYIEDYEDYIKKYPQGKYASEVNRVIENYYYKSGNRELSSKNYYKAYNYYNTYLSKFPYGSYNEEVRKKRKKSEKLYNQRSAVFSMLTIDSDIALGYSAGRINKDRLGGYANLSFNFDIFTEFDYTYTIDNAGNSDDPSDIEPTGEIQNARLAISGGITYKILYPIWGYTGIGFGYFPQYVEAREYYDHGNSYDKIWLKNTDESSYSAFPETGLFLKLSDSFVFKYGIMYHKGIIHQFGFGWQVK